MGYRDQNLAPTPNVHGPFALDDPSIRNAWLDAADQLGSPLIDNHPPDALSSQLCVQEFERGYIDYCSYPGEPQYYIHVYQVPGVHATEDRSENTFFSLRNRTPLESSVNVAFYTPDGRILDSRTYFRLPAHGSWFFDARSLLDGFLSRSDYDPRYDGYAIITSERALTVRVDPRIFLPLVFGGFSPGGPCSDAIVNGDFEAGPPPWMELSGNPPWSLVCDWANPGNTCNANPADPEYPAKYIPPWEGGAHGGTWDAWLGGYNSGMDTLSQGAIVPTGLTAADLSFWRYIRTGEPEDVPYDYLRVELRDAAGQLIAEVLTLDNTSAPRDQWRWETVDVLPYLQFHQGNLVQVLFRAETDLLYSTSFFVDDVRLDLCTASGEDEALPRPTLPAGYPPPGSPSPPTPAPLPGGYPPPPTPTPLPTPPAKTSPVGSEVADLPVYSGLLFDVRWSGSAPSGIVDYDVQVCRVGCTLPRNAVWTDWLTHTTATSAVYCGDHAQTHYFRSRARDRAGNVEPYPEGADAWTTVDAHPPSTAVEALPAYTYQSPFTIHWAGADDLSGLDHYDLYYRDESAAGWTFWLSAPPWLTWGSFAGQAGHSYHFCSRGVDRAGNEEICPPISLPWPIQSDARTAVAPGSRVNDLPPYTGSRTFTVSWGGSVGVEGYDVQVRDGFYGAWQTWKSNVPYTQANYTGQWGHIYCFRSRGREGAGREVYPHDYDAYTKLVEPAEAQGPPPPREAYPPDEAPDRLEEVTRTQGIGTPLVGFVAPEGDLDWYRFELTATMRLRVTLAELPADYDLYLFDGSGRFLWASTWGRRLPEEIVVRAPAGVYYVQLAGYAGAWDGEVPYRLLAERVGSGP